MTFSSLIPIFLFLINAGEIFGDDSCMQQFKDLGFIPKYADILKSADLQVEYAGKNITCGSFANFLDVSKPPRLYYNAPRCCKNITVLAFVPDPVVTAHFVTWLVINVPPENLRKGFSTPLLGNTDNNGYYAGNYAIPKNPGFTKTTHMAFFVYCQCDYISDKTIYPLPVRSKIDIKDYAKKNRLGNPMTGLLHKYTLTGTNNAKLTTGIVPDVPHLA